MASDALPFRVRPLHETADVSLVHFDHLHGVPLPDSEEPAAERFQINFVERGCFRLGYGSREWTLGAGSVFLSRPEDVYRYSHAPHVEPDSCLSLGFAASDVGGLTRIFQRLPLVIPRTNRLAFLGWRLSSYAAGDIPMALDGLACELVDAADQARTDRHRLHRPDKLKWYARKIGAAREMMAANPAGQHSLWRIASQVGMSPFRFARVFRELIGMPPHKYLIQLRLQRARVLLERGISVTAACYAVGFNGLSHFIRSFRSQFGTLPGDMKRPPRSPS